MSVCFKTKTLSEITDVSKKNDSGNLKICSSTVTKILYSYQNLWDAAKAVLRRKEESLISDEKSKVNELSIYLKI